MYAKWIDEDHYVGPLHRRICAIKKGEIRKIHAKSTESDHVYYMLEGKIGKYFGWVKASQIEILEGK